MAAAVFAFSRWPLPGLDAAVALLTPRGRLRMGLCAPSAAPLRRPDPLLRTALQSIEPAVGERREERRAAFPYRLRLTPLDGNAADAATVIVVGRDLSLIGIGFQHTKPLPCRRARLSAADPLLDDLGLTNFEIDVLLGWCRFVGSGRYESGGRIIRAASGQR